MKLGIFDHVDDDGRPAQQQLAERLELVELYDRLGFHAYHLAEHHGTPLGRAPSPNVFLASVAQRTVRLRFGPLVYVLPLYEPLRLIEEILMLDVISGGRLELGVGRGASHLESAFFGRDTDRARFEEALATIRAGLTSERLSYHGAFYDYEDVPMVLRPVQQPHPPLWMGVGRPESAVWAAANDVNIVALLPAPSARPIMDRYRQEWEALGKPANELPLLGLNRRIVLAETAAAAERVARRAYPRWKRNLDWLWDAHGVESPLKSVLPDEWDGYQRIGAGFAGTPEGAGEFFAAQAEEAGVSYIGTDIAFGDITFDEAARTAELLAEQVIPALAEAPAAT